MSDNPISDHKALFFDMPIDLFCVIHPETHKILEANIAFEYLLGWKSEEVVGKAIDAFTHSETDIANITKAFSKIKLGVHSIAFETEFHMKNNLIRSIDWKCYVDTESEQIFAIGRDITAYQEKQKALMEQSQVDSVTGVPNRQTLLTLLQNELSSAARYHFTAAIIMVDIDHFKNYNEKYGAQKGDECLRQIASALKTCLRRKTDFLARYENDGFIVLLSHNNLEKAIKSAEYIRSNIEKLTGGLTVSLGVAAISEITEKEIAPDSLINAAKAALNISQQRGGNQVNFAEVV